MKGDSMKLKKISLFQVIILILSVCLTACGGNSSDAKRQDSDETASQNKESKATTDVVEIEFFNQKSEIVDFINDLIVDFESENPGIKVTQTQVPDAKTVLNSRIASGDVPDVVGCYPDEAEFQAMVSGDTFADLTGDAVLENVDSSFLEDIKIDGKDYNVPLTLNSWGIYYNKTQFKALGLEVPTTWDDFIDVCETIKATGITPLATSLKEGWTTGHIGEAVALSIAGADGACDFFADPSVKFEDSVYYGEFINRLDTFADYSKPDASSTSYADAAGEFARGEALMMPQGIWTLPMFQQAGMTDEIGMFPLPNDEGKGVIQFGVDLAVSISADTPHLEEAKAFAAFLASPKAAQYLADKEGSPSTITGVTTDVPETEGVTSLLFETGRNEKWYHFSWEPGIDGEWGNEVASYFVLRDAKLLAQTLNGLFEKN